MSTRAETERAENAKKGVVAKRARKLGQRKPAKTSRSGPKVVDTPRTKRDTTAVIAHEVAATSPRARAARDQSKKQRVRAKS